MRISDWSSDVCSSDLERIEAYAAQWPDVMAAVRPRRADMPYRVLLRLVEAKLAGTQAQAGHGYAGVDEFIADLEAIDTSLAHHRGDHAGRFDLQRVRSEAHTSELQSLMRNSYAVFCLQKK